LQVTVLLQFFYRENSKADLQKNVVASYGLRWCIIQTAAIEQGVKKLIATVVELTEEEVEEIIKNNNLV
jgi:hypothetical protein